MSNTTPTAAAKSSGLSVKSVIIGLAAVVAAAAVGLFVGPIGIAPHRGAAELLNSLPFINLDSGLSRVHQAIITDLRAPRVVLGLLVGGMLAMSGATFQGAFRNPLADPYLLGVAAGAGVGATLAIVGGAGNGSGALDLLPLAAFGGALGAVGSTFLLGAYSTRRGFGGSYGASFGQSAATLILAGVAVGSFFAAVQTYIQMREVESLRSIYSWLLGRLSTSGWGEVALVAPYALVCGVVLMAFRSHLDVLAVGEEEAASLGLRPGRIRAIVLITASLAAAAAVAVSGLIGFVGLVVPHGVRLIFGVSNRVVVPLSFLFGGAFLALADVLARTAVSPAEIPIGVVTAFVGAPFFLLILRRHAAGYAY